MLMTIQSFFSSVAVAIIFCGCLSSFFQIVSCDETQQQAAANSNNSILLDGTTPPNLNGQNFKFTVVEDDGWVNIEENEEDGTLNFTGYCIDIIENIAKRANFTFELYPPSGFGKNCFHPPVGEEEDDVQIIKPYDKHYRGQYLCGQGDVQEDINRDEYTTDFFQSLFYVTPKRQLSNRFTLPFIPPTLGGMQLFGTATNISDIFDLIQQQKSDIQKLPVCLRGNTAAAEYIQNVFPELKTADKNFKSSQGVYELIEQGECELLMEAYPKVTRTILKLSKSASNQCSPNGMPIGVVGGPLLFGFHQFAIGIRQDLPTYVDRTFNYWMNELMTCSPGEASCDSFSEFYPEVGGIGDECGYNPNPPVQMSDEGSWKVGLIVGCVVASVGSFLIGIVGYNVFQRVERLHRIRTRFVQQIARTIDIGDSPDCICTGKMNELFKCITGSVNGDSVIDEVDFRKWMANDAELEYLSEHDLKVLWETLDKRGKGSVTQMDFISFLNKCEIQFKEVDKEKSSISAALQLMQPTAIRSIVNI